MKIINISNEKLAILQWPFQQLSGQCLFTAIIVMKKISYFIQRNEKQSEKVAKKKK